MPELRSPILDYSEDEAPDTVNDPANPQSTKKVPATTQSDRASGRGDAKKPTSNIPSSPDMAPDIIKKLADISEKVDRVSNQIKRIDALEKNVERMATEFDQALEDIPEIIESAAEKGAFAAAAGVS